MKLNAKIYTNLTSDPFETQEVDGKKIDFYYMNDTQYLFQFASKGRFSLWASDGLNYKVLIESKYYDVMKDFYQPEVNKIWIDFLERVSISNKKINKMFIIPTMLLYFGLAVLTSMFLSEYMIQVLLGLLGIIVISNMVQNRIITNKVRIENMDTQNQIREFLGHEKFDQLIDAQQLHYHEYFKFDEEPLSSEQSLEIEQIEVEEVQHEEQESKKD